MTSKQTIDRQATPQRWVIKIGSALLTDNGRGLAQDALDAWVAQIATLRKAGHEVVLVSSGAVAQGMAVLGWRDRPNSLHALQAAAAVGQMGLVHAYEKRFAAYTLKTAQVLLVHADLSSRTRYLNARQTLQALLAYGVIPIVNENDTVATEEIRFGDNDSLAGMVANLIDADRLLILTDQNGVYTADPRSDSAATLIHSCDAHDPILDRAAAPSTGHLGRGGMISKILAARLAARSGTSTVIANGLCADIILQLGNGEPQGTLLTTSRQPITARKQWLAGSLTVQGRLQLDDGAVSVVKNEGKSLLPIGVVRVVGDFQRGDLVACMDSHGHEIARGLVNYDAADSRKLAGCSSQKIADTLGYDGDQELIHRDNLVVL